MTKPDAKACSEFNHSVVVRVAHPVTLYVIKIRSHSNAVLVANLYSKTFIFNVKKMFL